jgi:ribulose-5-phosphate 4-epimerase/fuculose-1-phosphate aldolase
MNLEVGRRSGRDAAASEAERKVRRDLAAAYRLVALAGWDDLIYTHISARVPGSHDEFLINPFGLAFDEITASNLVRIDLAGNIVGDSPWRVNATGFAIHAAVHAARPDAHCVMHLHTPAGISVSMLECGLLPLSQHAMRFYRNIGYHAYEGLALDPDEGARLVAALGPHPALILRNHGTLTCGATVAEAYTLMFTLEKACATQLAAMAASDRLVVPPTDVLERTLAQLAGDPMAEGEREWPALCRRVERHDPSFLD